MVTIDAARTEWSSAEVLSGVTRLAAEGRAVTADLIALLAVLDERRLFEAEGCGSLFEFCVTRLRLSEPQAYHRIQAARAAARFPVILEHLRGSSVTLTSVALLRPVLTEANHVQLLADAAGRSKREVEGLVRSLAPLPDVRTSIRRLASCPTVIAAPTLACDRAPAPITEPSPSEEHEAPGDGTLLTVGSQAPSGRDCPVAAESTLTPGSQTGAIAAAFARRAEIRPLAPARYSLRVTISEETHSKLQQCQDLLGHAVPDGDPAAVLDRALTLLLASLERRRFAAKARRCTQTRRLEFHPPSRARPGRRASARSRRSRAEADHCVPFADGGAARSRTSLSGVERTTAPRRGAGAARRAWPATTLTGQSWQGRASPPRVRARRRTGTGLKACPD